MRQHYDCRYGAVLRDAPGIANKNLILAMELLRNSESKTLGSAYGSSNSRGLWGNRSVQTRMNLCGILARGQFQEKLFILDLPGLIPFLRPIAGQGPIAGRPTPAPVVRFPAWVLMRGAVELRFVRIQATPNCRFDATLAKTKDSI